jgi:hypothetical protein
MRLFSVVFTALALLGLMTGVASAATILDTMDSTSTGAGLYPTFR